MKEYMVEIGIKGRTFSIKLDGDTITDVIREIEEKYDVPSLDILKITEVKE